jgi:hypothetical protein
MPDCSGLLCHFGSFIKKYLWCSMFKAVLVSSCMIFKCLHATEQHCTCFPEWKHVIKSITFTSRDICCTPNFYETGFELYFEINTFSVINLGSEMTYLKWDWSLHQSILECLIFSLNFKFFSTQARLNQVWNSLFFVNNFQSILHLCQL